MYQLVAWQGTWWKPVTQILPLLWILRVHNAAWLHPRCHPINVSLHRLVVRLEHLHIAIVTVELPRHNLHSSTPAYATATAWLPGGTIGNITLGGLRSANVAYPLVVERLRREVVHNRNARHLTITRIC